jgi:hypothetical protein
MRMGMVVDRDCHGPDQLVESVREAHATRGYGEWNGGGRGLPRAWVGSDTREEGSWNGGGRGLSRPWLGRGKGKEGHGTASCSWSHEAGRLVARAPRLEAGSAPMAGRPIRWPHGYVSRTQSPRYPSCVGQRGDRRARGARPFRTEPIHRTEPNTSDPSLWSGRSALDEH